MTFYMEIVKLAINLENCLNVIITILRLKMKMIKDSINCVAVVQEL